MIEDVGTLCCNKDRYIHHEMDGARGPRLSLHKVNFRRGSRSKPEGIERPAAPVAYRENRARWGTYMYLVSTVVLRTVVLSR